MASPVKAGCCSAQLRAVRRLVKKCRAPQATTAHAGKGVRQALAAVAYGVRFVRGHRLIVGLLLIDAAAMVFTMPQALYPILADQQFGGGPGVVGLLYAAPALGALIGAATAAGPDASAVTP